MATRPVTGNTGWGTTYDTYEEVSHNLDGTLKLIGSESDGHVSSIITGFQFFNINGVSTKVYTKYLTGTKTPGSSFNSAHGLDDADNILHVSSAVESDTGIYLVYDYRDDVNATNQYALTYDDTNVILGSLGSQIDGATKYRIKIEYIGP